MIIVCFIAHFIAAIFYLKYVDINTLCEIYHMTRMFGEWIVCDTPFICQTFLPNAKNIKFATKHFPSEWYHVACSRFTPLNCWHNISISILKQQRNGVIYLFNNDPSESSNILSIGIWLSKYFINNNKKLSRVKFSK